MNDSDALLVRQALAGDRAAAEALVRRYLGAAYAVALAHLRHPSDAEDVAQEAVATALSRLAECRDPDRFSAWLLRMVRNRAVDVLRARRRRPEAPLESAGEVACRHDPLRDAERAEQREQIYRALEHLTEMQRKVVLLHDLEGWPHRDIARELGISEVAARVRLHSARKILRARLELVHAMER